MISSIPSSAAPGASRRASANDAHTTGDAFGDLLQKAVGARQPAVSPTVERRPPEHTSEPAADDSTTNERPADTATNAVDDATPTAESAEHGEHDARAAATTAGAASVVATPSVGVAPSTTAAPVDASTTATPPVAAKAAPAVDGDVAVAKAPDAPVPLAVGDTAVVAKDVVDEKTDDDKSDAKRDGAQHPATPVAVTGHADVSITDNGANRVGERVPSAPTSAEPVATAVHADHQALARAADVMTTGQHAGPTTTNRLSLEMDGNSRVAVRMDDTGRFVRVDVLADPNGRLDGAWHSDISESLRHHGLELDQRGADTSGEGHRRKDQTDDRFATDGGSPRKPVRSRTARPGSLWL